MGNFESGPVSRMNDKEPLKWEDAAIPVKVEGWSCARCSVFYGNGAGAERAARYCCHTDAPCETEGCPNRKKRHRIKCDSCYHKDRVAQWQGLLQVPSPSAPSNECPLAVLDGDTYFFDEDSLLDYCEEHELKPSDAFLVLCQPHNPPDFSIDDAVQDYLPGDGYCNLPGDEGAAAEQAVNTYLRAHDPWSWYADNQRRPSDEDLKRFDAVILSGPTP